MTFRFWVVVRKQDISQIITVESERGCGMRELRYSGTGRCGWQEVSNGWVSPFCLL